MKSPRPSRKQKPPYASLSPSLLATRRVRDLSPVAVRVMLWANAVWVPGKPTMLPSARISKAMGIERTTFASAKKALMLAGLLVQTREAIRPGAAGFQCGRTAAEFQLPYRAKGPTVRFDQGDPKFRGYWRVSSENLRTISTTLEDAALRILICIVIPQNRQKDGGLAWVPEEWNPPPRQRGGVSAKPTAWEQLGITATRSSDALGISLRTAQRGLDALAGYGLLRVVQRGIGRKSTVYVPAGFAASGLSYDRIVFRSPL